MRRRNELVREGAIVLAGTLGSNALGYAFHFAMSRLLGVTGYGSLVSLLSLVTLVSIPALVAQTLVAKTVASYTGIARVEKIRRFARTIVPRAAAIALLVATALALGRSAIMHFLRVDDSSGILIVAWAVLFYLVVPILNGILQGDQRFAGLTSSIVCDAVLRAGLAIAFVTHGSGINGAISAVAIGAVFAALISAAFVSDLLLPPGATSNVPFAVPNLSGALRLSLGVLVISTLASIDVLLVKHFCTAYEAGLFGSLSLIGRIVYFVASFVPTIILPKATARISAGVSPRPLLFVAAVAFGLALSSVLVPLLLAPAFVLRLVAGGAYATAAPLLAAYGSAIAFLAAAFAAANYKIGVNRLGFVAPVSLIGLAEVALICIRHDSLATIITILAAGHFCIFLATIFRIWIDDEHHRALQPGLAS